MFTAAEIAVLVLIGALGHAMALCWYLADRYKWSIGECTIYDLPIPRGQIKRELQNSFHAPMHAVLLAIFLRLSFFQNRSFAAVHLFRHCSDGLAEIWHYVSHRAFHLRMFHWIHLEHHRSHINSCLTAMSFSFTERLVFDLGMLVPLAVADYFFSLNFFGIAAWFISYLVINSFSHANFEPKSKDYNRWRGKVLTTTTYHSLHHSRYTGNYGAATRVLDRIFKTEWEDYERLYDRVTGEERPLTKLRERVEAPVTGLEFRV
jgi:Delta7-sterol 5-desaturase